VSVKARKRGQEAGGLKKPSGRDYLVFYGTGVAGVLLLGLLFAVFEFSRHTFLVAGFVWAAVYGPVAVLILHTRRELPMPS
jgi:hypothetical protein